LEYALIVEVILGAPFSYDANRKFRKFLTGEITINGTKIIIPLTYQTRATG